MADDLRERIARAIEARADGLDAERAAKIPAGRCQAGNRWDLEMKGWGLREAARIARETPSRPSAPRLGRGTSGPS